MFGRFPATYIESVFLNNRNLQDIMNFEATMTDHPAIQYWLTQSGPD